MNDLYRTARLHHQTVATYQAHLSSQDVRVRHSKSATIRVQVDPRVWRIAFELADKDSSRIVVRSPTEVIVTNQTKRSKSSVWRRGEK